MTTTTQQKNLVPQKASPIYGLAAKFQIEPEKLVDVLRGTVIKPDKNGRAATNEEMAAFCIVAQQYGLNPFTREIHAFVSGDKGVVPVVGIDGWTKIVNSHSDFDGCEFVDEADEQGRPISITCKMYVRGRSHAVCITERFAECKRNTQPWNTMPWRLLRHKSYMQAARYAFGLSGIYDEDEARDVIRAVPTGTADPLSRTKKVAAAIETITADPPQDDSLDAIRSQLESECHAKSIPIRTAMTAAGVASKASTSWTVQDCEAGLAWIRAQSTPEAEPPAGELFNQAQEGPYGGRS